MSLLSTFALNDFSFKTAGQILKWFHIFLGWPVPNCSNRFSLLTRWLQALKIDEHADHLLLLNGWIDFEWATLPKFLPFHHSAVKHQQSLFFMYLFNNKKGKKKSMECHNHKPQPFPDTKRKRKQTSPNKRKSNKRTKSIDISSLFPKRGNRNAKKTEKLKKKITQGKT